MQLKREKKSACPATATWNCISLGAHNTTKGIQFLIVSLSSSGMSWTLQWGFAGAEDAGNEELLLRRQPKAVRYQAINLFMILSFVLI